MTKVQLPLQLTRPLDEDAMSAIAAAHGYYGIHFIKVAPSLDHIIVEYDASRLNPHEVLSALQQFGIPALEQLPHGGGSVIPATPSSQP